MMEPEEVVVYRSGDGDPRLLDGQVLAVIGYGNLGRSMALNLRDSGCNVTVGNIDDEYRAIAEADGFEVRGIAEAVAAANLVYLLIPDEEIPDVFQRDVAAQLSRGAGLCLASGYVLAFELIAPPAEIDVLLLAPRMLGEQVRGSYQDGTGFFSYVSVERNASGRALPLLLALAEAVGSLRRGAMRLSARQEALIDLLVEQTLGPVIGGAVITTFHAGVDAGLPAEAMVLELYMSGEMSRTFAAFAEDGFFRSTRLHGLVALFGGFLRFGAVDLDNMDTVFREVIEDISSGGFAGKLQQERDLGYPTMAAAEAMTAGDDLMTRAEDRVRSLLQGKHAR